VTLQAMLVLGEERLRESRFIGVSRLREALSKRAYARLRGRDPRRALFACGDTIAADLQQADEKRQRRRVDQ